MVSYTDRLNREWKHLGVVSDHDYPLVDKLAQARWERKSSTVKLVFRMVGKGPRMLRVFAPHRRSYQELVYAWGDLEFGTKGMSAFVALSDRAQRARGMRGLSTRLDMESVIRNAAELPASYPRLSVEEWRNLVDREETRERIRVADERYLEMMTKAVKVNRKILKVPQDPMLLIDGKYLLTSPITGKITDLFSNGELGHPRRNRKDAQLRIQTGRSPMGN